MFEVFRADEKQLDRGLIKLNIRLKPKGVKKLNKMSFLVQGFLFLLYFSLALDETDSRVKTHFSRKPF